MAAPTTPGPFTSPVAGQKVDEQIVVSWGASTKTLDHDVDTKLLTVTSPSAVIVNAESATLSDDAGLYTITDNGDGTFGFTTPDELDGILSYRLYRDDGIPNRNITFTDNGDGTWTAVSDGAINTDGSGYFEILETEAVYLDLNNYVVTSTTANDEYLGFTEDTSMVIDTLDWPDTTAARFRVEAFGNGVFTSSVYSNYFTIEHPRLFRIGDVQADEVYIGNTPVDAIYMGTVQVW